MPLPSAGHAIYGSDTLAKLYDEFTGKTIFNRSRKFCLAPSMGGSLFGAEQKEAPLYKSDFNTLIDMAYNSEAKINRTMPIGSLYYFKCENEDYYKTRATRYFNLIKTVPDFHAHLNRCLLLCNKIVKLVVLLFKIYKLVNI